MGGPRRLLLAWTAVLWASAASAQLISLPPSTLIGCMTPPPAGRGLPEHDPALMAAQVGGTVRAELVLTAPDREPVVRLLGESVDAALVESVRRPVRQLRVPCQAGEPREIDPEFSARIQGAPRTVIQDMTPTQFLGNAASMPRPAEFDLTTMGCPFELRITHYLPCKRNIVGRVETARPERRVVLDWLSRIPLRLTPSETLAVLGDSFTVSVPVAKLAL